MLAEIMKPYPSSGCLNFELSSAENEDNRRIFQDLVAEVTAERKVLIALLNNVIKCT